MHVVSAYHMASSFGRWWLRLCAPSFVPQRCSRWPGETSPSVAESLLCEQSGSRIARVIACRWMRCWPPRCRQLEWV